jgi:glycosyltransferase involved in cell wall biosynthesis
VIAGIAELGEVSSEARARAYETGDIVFFGRLVFEKGCDDLVRAYELWRRRPPDTARRGWMPRLVIFGRGPELASLQELASSLGVADHVQFRSFVGGRELARIAREASVVVVPSRWEEPGATIGVELFACGAAVITTERGALGEIFSDQGRLYPNGNVEALASALGEHFASGPIYPRPTGREPWLVPAIELDVLDVLR